MQPVWGKAKEVFLFIDFISFNVADELAGGESHVAWGGNQGDVSRLRAVTAGAICRRNIVKLEFRACVRTSVATATATTRTEHKMHRAKASMP